MGLSFGEIIVIILVAFLVLGPDKLPEAGRALGKTVNSFKKALNNTNLDLKEEVDAIKKETGISEIEAFSKQAKEKEAAFKNELSDLRKEIKLDEKDTDSK